MMRAELHNFKLCIRKCLFYSGDTTGDKLEKVQIL